MRSFLASFLLFTALATTAQVVSNITCTNASALAVMKGQYDPAAYGASMVIDDHAEIICAIRTQISADSLREQLKSIAGFGTRHSYSDTVSNTTGMGAARRWAYSRFEAFSAANEERLIPAYLQFDNTDNVGQCGNAAGWRNVLAVLPGRIASPHRTVLIEAHLDSRCDLPCDAQCDAAGAEDNGSGSALVIELARVLSAYTFDHTLIFMLTTAEEQGLIGAKAMARFCADENIAIKGVLNNDVIGGILCGHTSSPPSCPGPGEVDSLQVRLFSDGTSNTAHRPFARTIKMYYQEKLRQEVQVPMTISIMEREDRFGRGGDHIPFRELGFRNVRFTAANEHGDGDPSQEGYDDRQHTSEDILGVDTDGDLVVDSFFVDFNYLQRNAVINGMVATLLAHGPEAPTFTLLDEPAGLRVSIVAQPDAVAYRVGVRSLNDLTDFAAVYRTTELSFPVPGLQANRAYQVSVAALDAQGIMSPFSPEQLRLNDADTPGAPIDQLPYRPNCAPIGIGERATSIRSGLLPCSPNPTHGGTTFTVNIPQELGRAIHRIIVRDALGRILIQLLVPSGPGQHKLVLERSLPAGVYPYSLVVDGRTEDSKKMVVLE